jgi:hypothetical protein
MTIILQNTFFNLFRVKFQIYTGLFISKTVYIFIN